MDMIAAFGYSMKTNRREIHPKEFQKLLGRIQDTPEEALISRLALRSMKQARYTTENTGHFGLAVKYYCHFTSPIRRYPDLQIHRIIKENLHGTLNEVRQAHYRKILPEVAGQSSMTERRADEAEREVERLKKVEYMSSHIGEIYTGVVSGLAGFGMYVELEIHVRGSYVCRIWMTIFIIMMRMPLPLSVKCPASAIRSARVYVYAPPKRTRCQERSVLCWQTRWEMKGMAKNTSGTKLIANNKKAILIIY